MIAVLGLALGGLYGWRVATKRDGNTQDKLQYGAAFGIAFFLLFMIIGVLLDANGVFGG